MNYVSMELKSDLLELDHSDGRGFLLREINWFL